MSPEPRPTLHRISKFEQRLTEALLECAVRDSPDALNAVYRANGLDRDIATRADVLFLAIAVTRSALNFGFRHLSRFRRAEEDCEAILVELDQSALSESVDPLAARQLLRWACRVTSEGEDFPRFPRDDSTAKTYIVVAAASLVYSVGPLSNWRKRYRSLARGTRHISRVPSELRSPAE